MFKATFDLKGGFFYICSFDLNMSSGK